MHLRTQYNRNLKILQLDGGGLLAIMYLSVLSALEKALGKKCHDIFNIIMGTSTGGIVGSLLSSGMSAQDILNLYLENADRIFKKRALGFASPLTWIYGSRYDRAYLDSLLQRHLDFPMSDCKCTLIITGVCMDDIRHTHFFKSYKPKYRGVPVYLIVQVTASAPTYFGYMTDTQGLLGRKDAKWTDGGVGVFNCTLSKAEIEAKNYQNAGDNYWILSCGCGYVCKSRSPSSFLINQITDFIGIAREQAVWEQIKEATERRVNFSRIDDEISSEHYQMDDVSSISYWLEQGRIWAQKFLPQIIE